MKIKIIDYGIKEAEESIPEAKHFDDAGADVRILKDTVLPPKATVKVPLGFGIELPNGLMGLFFSRSSMNAKGITVFNSPIDSGYRGELSIILYNNTGIDVHLEKGTRIGQIVVLPYMPTEFVWDFEEVRGTGGFGSTGEK